jgi:hypothetical protein
MMGHINNMIVQLVRENLGEDGVAALFREAGVEPQRFQSEVIYPEPMFQSLFRAAQTVFGADRESAELVFSEHFMRVSPQLYPAIFKHAGSARSLLEKVPMIHRNFPAAAARGQYKDKLRIVESTPERVLIEYDSPNQLCITLRTVAGMVLAFYNERGSVTEHQCAKDGHPHCLLEVRFEGRAAA